MAYKDEGGHGAQADGLCMIDPVVLGGVINDLATMESAIGAELKGLKAEFAKVCVSTQPLTDLTNVATWLHTELPMLRRRRTTRIPRHALGPGNPDAFHGRGSDGRDQAGRRAACCLLQDCATQSTASHQARTAWPLPPRRCSRSPHGKAS